MENIEEDKNKMCLQNEVRINELTKQLNVEQQKQLESLGLLLIFTMHIIIKISNP